MIAAAHRDGQAQFRRQWGKWPCPGILWLRNRSQPAGCLRALHAGEKYAL